MSDYRAVIERLDGVRKLQGGARWLAKCPVHDDKRPSLCVWVGQSGCLCAKCMANQGCKFKDIVRATGTRISDWFPEETRRGGRVDEQRKIVATYDYVNEDGEFVYQVVRFEPKSFAQRRPDGNGGWIWNLDGVRKILYNLPAILAAPKSPVVIVEGEKDVETMRALGLLATTNPGGAGKFDVGYCWPFSGRRVAIIPDNDTAGLDHAFKVAACLMWWNQLFSARHDAKPIESVRVVHLVHLPPKGDVSDWLKLEPEGMDRKKNLLTLIRDAQEWRMVPQAKVVA